MPDDNLQEAMAGMREGGTWYRKYHGGKFTLCRQLTQYQACRLHYTADVIPQVDTWHFKKK